MQTVIEASRKAGAAFAAILHNVRLDQLDAVKSASATYDANAEFGRKVAHLAVDVLRAGEGEGTAAFAMYMTLTKEAQWTPEHSEMLHPFLEALAEVQDQLKQAADEKATEKMAGTDGKTSIVDDLLAAVGAGRKGYGDYLNAMLSAGLVGGLATGTAHWALDQDITPVTEKRPPLDAEIAAKEEERDYFRRVRQETENRMRRSLSSKNPGSQAAAAAVYA